MFDLSRLKGAIAVGQVNRYLRTSAVVALTLLVALVQGINSIDWASTEVPPIALNTQQAHSTEDLTQYVDPFIGTSSGGNTFPGATYPFGMVQWSPDTQGNTPGGYNYGSNVITGFSLTHLSGAGAPVFGDFPFIPYSGTVTQPPTTNQALYAMKYSHGNESASPGAYSVALDNGINVKLTATERTGYGQFSFPSGSPANLLINSGGSANGNTSSTVEVSGNDLVTGSATSGSFAWSSSDKYTVYFAARFEQPFISYQTWNGNNLSPGSPSESGSQTGVVLTFPSNQGQVDVKVGISYVSPQGALRNLAKEDPGWGFRNVQTSTQAEWNTLLNRIQVTGGTTSEKTVFYTALYHCLLAPTIFSDVNGQYIGFDGRIHNAGNQPQYANFSGWDIYRSEIPLLAWLFPHRTSDMIESLVRDGEQEGALPKWPIANQTTGTMDGDSADPIISEAYALGATNFDTNEALKLMIQGATNPNSVNGYTERPGLSSYLTKGYVSQSNAASPSDTLEYALDDFAIGKFAEHIGASSGVATEFLKRGQNWQNLFNPATDLIQPRYASGAFVSSIQPTTWTNYMEGTAYQYLWMVPQDYTGLFAALGGDAAAVRDLDTFFTELNQSNNTRFAWMGNEPCLVDPWAYDFARAPSHTQSVVRRIQESLYTNSPGGLPGNDDLGTMSAWYVWSALGMYPAIPGESGFALGSPLFPEAKVNYSGGNNTLTIVGDGASDSSPYVQSLSLNGNPVMGTWITDQMLQGTNNAILAYKLGSQPSAWGTNVNNSASTSGNPEIIASDPRSALADGLATGGRASAVGSTHTLIFQSMPADTVGLAPGIGFTGTSAYTTEAGHSLDLSFGIRDVSALRGRFRWTANAPALISIGKPFGITRTERPGQSSRISVHVAIPADTPEGIYPINFTGMTSKNKPVGRINPVTVIVTVKGSNNLPSLYDNSGISNASAVANASFDNGGRSYSQQALRQSGIVPGARFKVDGISVDWPYSTPGMPDNVIAQGQTFSIKGSGTKLVFVGASSNGPAEGTGTIFYTDGTKQPFNLGFSDWTLGGGGDPIAYGDSILATTSYRNVQSGSSVHDATTTYLFDVAIPLQPGKSVASIELPHPQNQGAMHVFCVGIG